MNYLLSILIIAVLAPQATIWHPLATVRDAIQQTNASFWRPAAAMSGRVRSLPTAARSSLARSWYARASAMDSRVGTAVIIPAGSKGAAKTEQRHKPKWFEAQSKAAFWRGVELSVMSTRARRVELRWWVHVRFVRSHVRAAAALRNTPISGRVDRRR